MQNNRKPDKNEAAGKSCAFPFRMVNEMSEFKIKKNVPPCIYLRYFFLLQT